MDLIRKYGFWAASGIIALAAIAVYFAFVPAIIKQRKEKAGLLEQRRSALETWAKKGNAGIPNEPKITEALTRGKRVTLQLDQCANYLSRQPRRSQTLFGPGQPLFGQPAYGQTRSFFEDEHSDQQVEVPFTRPTAWRREYAKNVDELKRQLLDAGFGSAFPVQTLEGTWGAVSPKPEQIADAMQLFWFQKDLADFVTEQVEKDLIAYMALKAPGREDPFPAEPSDLVINRNPGRLDDLLRSKSKKQLAAILKAIVVNTQERDLAMIFNDYLPDEGPNGVTTADNGFPWERQASPEKPSVLGLTIDAAQKNFLNEMAPPDKDDLANRQRFLDYIMELRTVRYREDVIGLLESDPRFDELAKSLKKGTEIEYARVLTDFDKEEWTPTRLAQAIAAIVSITNKKDYLLVRANHSQDIAGLENVTIKFTGSAHGEAETPVRGAAAAAPGDTDIYKVRTFSMRVKVEFKRLPIFLRRLLSNSWRYRVRIEIVRPVAVSANKAEGERAMPSGQPLPSSMPSAGMPSYAKPGPAAPVTETATPQPEPEVVEAGHFVTVQLDGEGFQFKTAEKPAGSATPAPPPGRR